METILQLVATNGLENEQHINELIGHIRSGSIRDFWQDDSFPVRELYALPCKLIKRGWDTGDTAAELQGWWLWARLVALPDFDPQLGLEVGPTSAVPPTFVQGVFDRFSLDGGPGTVGTYSSQCLNFSKRWLYLLYNTQIFQRRRLRLVLGQRLQRSITVGADKYGCIGRLLELLICILEGLQKPIERNVWFPLLETVLLPLHDTTQMVEWRDQVSFIR
jgi:hypothetical protein